MALRVTEHECTLSQVIEGERGECYAKPRCLDRLAAEVPQIGVERLGARHRKKHQTEHDQSEHAIVQQKSGAKHRIECGEHARLFGDADQAHGRQNCEPNQDDRTKVGGHFARSTALHGKQPDQDGNRQRHHQLLESRSD